MSFLIYLIVPLVFSVMAEMPVKEAPKLENIFNMWVCPKCSNMNSGFDEYCTVCQYKKGT